MSSRLHPALNQPPAWKFWWIIWSRGERHLALADLTKRRPSTKIISPSCLVEKIKCSSGKLILGIFHCSPPDMAEAELFVPAPEPLVKACRVVSFQVLPNIARVSYHRSSRVPSGISTHISLVVFPCFPCLPYDCSHSHHVQISPALFQGAGDPSTSTPPPWVLCQTHRSPGHGRRAWPSPQLNQFHQRTLDNPEMVGGNSWETPVTNEFPLKYAFGSHLQFTEAGDNGWSVLQLCHFRSYFQHQTAQKQTQGWCLWAFPSLPPSKHPALSTKTPAGSRRKKPHHSGDWEQGSKIPLWYHDEAEYIHLRYISC